jgi:hypothetical protein
VDLCIRFELLGARVPCVQIENCDHIHWAQSRFNRTVEIDSNSGTEASVEEVRSRRSTSSLGDSRRRRLGACSKKLRPALPPLPSLPCKFCHAAYRFPFSRAIDPTRAAARLVAGRPRIRQVYLPARVLRAHTAVEIQVSMSFDTPKRRRGRADAVWEPTHRGATILSIDRWHRRKWTYAFDSNC